MTLKPPILDNRNFEAVLSRLRENVSRYMPDWGPGQDADAGADPGVMLQHTFARLMEIAIERLNRVPEKQLLAFLHEMNISPAPPVPARAPLVFTQKKETSPATVPRGTAVSAKMPGSPASVFETLDDLTVLPAAITCAYAIEPGRKRYGDYTGRLSGSIPGSSFTPFIGEDPMPDAWYFIIDESLEIEKPAKTTLTLTFANEIYSGLLSSYIYGSVFRRRVEWSCSGEEGDQLFIPEMTTPHGEDRYRKVSYSIKNYEGISLFPEPAASLGGGCEPPAGGYVKCAITSGLHGKDELDDIPIVSAELSVEGSEAPARHLFSRSSRLDPEGYVLPFGDHPNAGDAFFIDVGDLPEETGAVRVTLYLIPDVDKAEDAKKVGKTLTWDKLDWTYTTPDGWKSVRPEAETVTTAQGAVEGQTNYTYPLTFKLERPYQHKVGGEEGYWLRATLQTNDCGMKAEYITSGGGYILKPGTGTFVYPKVRSLTVGIGFAAECEIYRQKAHIYTKPGEVYPFAEPPLELRKTAFYLGFDRFFPMQPVSLYVDVTPSSSSIKLPEDKDAAWEYLAADDWRPLYVNDDTGGLSRSGAIRFLTPSDPAGAISTTLFDNTERFWVRLSGGGGVRLSGIYMNAVPAEQAVSVAREAVGISNGAADQRFTLRGKPVLSGQRVWVRENEVPTSAESAETEVEIRQNTVTLEREIWVLWAEQSSFSVSRPDSRHYTLDRENGEICFGDGDRGMPPADGAAIAAEYRFGGGAYGNVPAYAITKLSAKMPGVDSAHNPIPASGGADYEDITEVTERGPMALRHRGRGVTAPDIEWLAKEAAGSAADRIKCLPGEGGRPFTLMILPAEEGLRPLPAGALSAHVREYLDRRLPISLSGGSYGIVGPRYLTTGLSVAVVPADPLESSIVRDRVAERLFTFLHPRQGGLDGSGWEFGRNVYLSEVCALIETVEGVGQTLASKVVISPAAAQQELALQTNDIRLEAAYPAGSQLSFYRPFDEATERWLLAEPIVTDVLPGVIRVTGLREGDELTMCSTYVFSTDENQFQGNIFTFPAGSAARTGKDYTTALKEALKDDRIFFTADILDPPIPEDELTDGCEVTLYHPDTLVVADVRETDDGGYEITARRSSRDMRFLNRMVLECVPRKVSAVIAEEYSRLIAYEDDMVTIRFGGFNETRRLQGPVNVTLSLQEGLPKSVDFKISSSATVTDTAYLYERELCTPGFIDVHIAEQEE